MSSIWLIIRTELFLPLGLHYSYYITLDLQVHCFTSITPTYYHKLFYCNSITDIPSLLFQLQGHFLQLCYPNCINSSLQFQFCDLHSQIHFSRFSRKTTLINDISLAVLRSDNACVIHEISYVSETVSNGESNIAIDVVLSAWKTFICSQWTKQSKLLLELNSTSSSFVYLLS